MSDQSISTGLDIEACIEALLFAASGPLTVAELASALECKNSAIEAGLAGLEAAYQNGRGLALQRHQGRFQLTTHPAAALHIERLLGLEASSRLSRAAVETLAIVAYRQPVTRPGIDAVRGVNSDGVLKSLLSKGLVEEVGRTEGPGRPILYGTTADFLQHFGLSSLVELPELALDEASEPGAADDRLLKD